MRSFLLTLPVVFMMASAHADFTNQEEVSDLEVWKYQIEDGRGQEAIAAMTDALARDPNNADLLNLMGYGHRKTGQFERARAFYEQALSIDPDHRGALEYFGELELQEGRIPAARALLMRLQKTCLEGCEELDDLEEAFRLNGVATGS